MAVQSAYNEFMTKAFPGMLYDLAPHTVVTMVSEETQEIAFGRAVVFAGGSDDKGVLLPDAPAEVVAGILLHSHDYAKDDELGTTGVKTGARLNILRKGRVWVICASGCAPGDNLWVRQDITGGGAEAEGALENAQDTDNLDYTTKGTWLSTAAAGGLALLEVDFTGA